MGGLRHLPSDLLTVPINGWVGNMDHEGAVDFVAADRPRVVIPKHYGMLRDNTADPQVFIDPG